MERETLRCAVTGANGYVGSAIAAYLCAQGAEVVELNRRAEAGTPGNRVVPFRLGEDVPAGAFDGVDALVHCAYDFNAAKWDDIKRNNVDASLRLFAAAHAAGVRRIVFISTMSAFEGCRSLYGRAKLQVEEGGRQYGLVAVRPGLVFDEGDPKGMVGALAKVINLSPIVPLIGSGRQVLYPCHAEDLARLVHHLCTAADVPAKPITAASPQGLTFKQILAGVARTKGKRVAFMPIPAGLLLGLLRMTEVIGIRSRLRADSLVSLVNQNPKVEFEPVRSGGLSFRGFSFPQSSGVPK